MSEKSIRTCEWPRCSDDLPAVCGESLWLADPEAGPVEWQGVELLCVGVNPLTSSVYFLSERNPTWYECVESRKLSHERPTVVQALKAEALAYSRDPARVGVDTGDPASVNRWLCSVIERAAAAKDRP